MASWSFVHATDIHVGSPKSFRFQPAWNENWQTARRQIVDIHPDLLILSGDLTRDGSLHRYELEAIKADLDALPFPCLVAPGNMDTGNKHTQVSGPLPNRDDVSLNVTSEQIANFNAVFGPTQWTVEHKGVRFSGFCDMVAGSGLPEEQALWGWLERQTELAPARRQVWITHSPLFVEDPDEPSFDITDPAHYLDWYFGVSQPARSRILDVFRATRTALHLCGHVHCRKRHRVGATEFHIGPSTAFAQWAERWPDGAPDLGFVRYDVTGDGIESTFVPLERVSNAKGYGPGGHVPPELRDYSIAWER